MTFCLVFVARMNNIQIVLLEDVLASASLEVITEAKRML